MFDSETVAFVSGECDASSMKVAFLHRCAIRLAANTSRRPLSAKEDDEDLSKRGVGNCKIRGATSDVAEHANFSDASAAVLDKQAQHRNTQFRAATGRCGSETLISARGQNDEWRLTAASILSKCVASIGPLIAGALSVATAVAGHAGAAAAVHSETLISAKGRYVAQAPSSRTLHTLLFR
eukprot:s9641_g1.t1